MKLKVNIPVERSVDGTYGLERVVEVEVPEDQIEILVDEIMKQVTKRFVVSQGL